MFGTVVCRAAAYPDSRAPYLAPPEMDSGRGRTVVGHRSERTDQLALRMLTCVLQELRRQSRPRERNESLDRVQDLALPASAAATPGESTPGTHGPAEHGPHELKKYHAVDVRGAAIELGGMRRPVSAPSGSQKLE